MGTSIRRAVAPGHDRCSPCNKQYQQNTLSCTTCLKKKIEIAQGNLSQVYLAQRRHLPEIKQFFVGQVANRASMSALDVISHNLQVGLHIHSRPWHQNQVATQLTRVRLLSVLSHLRGVTSATGGCIASLGVWV